MWLGEGAALSHLSAARRYGLTVPSSESVWATVPLSTKPRPRPGLILTRTGVPSGVAEVLGLRCLEPARVIADLAQCTSAEVLKSVLLSSIQRRLVTESTVSEVCAALGHRPGNGTLRGLLRLFKPETESWLEDLWAQGQRRLGFTGWRQQMCVTNTGGQVISRADFGDEQARLIVQLDGFAYHSTAAQMRRDKAMDRATARLGHLTLRYDAMEVTTRLEECLREAEAMRVARLTGRAA